MTALDKFCQVFRSSEEDPRRPHRASGRVLWRAQEEYAMQFQKIKQQFCVVMGLQKKTYNTQLALSGHNTMAKALVVAKASGRVLCSEKGNWVL